MTYAFANIMTAFDEKTIGSKVIDQHNFCMILNLAIDLHDWDAERVQGQAYIKLDPASHLFVSCGSGKRSDNPDDYVLRKNRGRIDAYLKREFASKFIHAVHVVVYTRDGYMDDPDVRNDQEEKNRVAAQDPSHVLVAVLATPCPGFVSPYRFVANLAGGNKSYEPGKVSVGELRDLAQRVKEYDDNWVVVAD